MNAFYKENILRWYAEHEKEMTGISDKIWEYAEIKFKEFKSSALLADTLEGNGFKVARNVAGLETAFTAEWSNGEGPTIALLGEYDALEGLGNDLVNYKSPNGKNGHGCGHNLLGTASMSAALCLKNTMEETGVKGRIRYYGCPAEEGGGGKTYMVRDGLFDDIDAVVRWHPINVTHAPLTPCFATLRGKCTFRNTKEYLGFGSQLGRNALDAAMLVDVAVSYLRNSVPKDTQVRAMISKGAVNLGLNPVETEVLFGVNAPENDTAKEYYEKILRIIRGVAISTGTEVEVRGLTAYSSTLPNKILCKAMLDNMLEVGPPAFDDKDKELAKELVKDISDAARAKSLRMYGVTDSKVCASYLHDGISTNMLENVKLTPYATDSGDVSRKAPMCQCFVAGLPIGATNHSWQQVVSSGSSIGHKTVIAAGKYLSMTAMNILTDPELLEAAKEEFDAETAKHPYTCQLPAHAVPGEPWEIKL